MLITGVPKILQDSLLINRQHIMPDSYCIPPDRTTARTGFTLIELSIVLVIIGLIIGGILTGQDLINSAAIRAQISQIEKYNTAVNAFRGKYGYLPGDLPDPYATQFGFTSRGGVTAGEGDGNGLIQGGGGMGNGGGNQEGGGETVTFWVDLSTAGLIDAGLNTATDTGYMTMNTVTILNKNFPSAKIANGNYLYVYGGGYYNNVIWVSDGFNYYGLSALQPGNWTVPVSTPALTVVQAYNIDKKMDDGLPQSGGVQANYLNVNLCANSAAWAAGGGNTGVGGCAPTTPTTAQTAYSATNCYDNNNSATNTPQTYSLKNTTTQNCALSFRFQ